MLIRRLATMTESIDVKAGIKSVLERIDIACKSRSDQVMEQSFWFRSMLSFYF